MAYTIGPISGCHINPAVTLGMVIGGKTDARTAPFYVVGQLIGGLAGGLALRVIFRASASSRPRSARCCSGLSVVNWRSAAASCPALATLVRKDSRKVSSPVRR